MRKLTLYTGLALALIAPNNVHAHSEEPKYIAQTDSFTKPVFEASKVEPVVKTEVITERPRTPEVPAAPQIRPTAESGATSSDGLTGSIGYAKPGGNCVNEPGVNRQSGNPISWSVLYMQPHVGATALFNYNHTGVVTGVWSNGDVEVRHQNYAGSQHRFPRSAFRGFR